MDKDQCDRQGRELVLHAEQIARLFSQVQDTNNRLLAIEKSISQIRNMCYGAVCYGVVAQLGIIEAIKL
jgi:hypothetical protein